MSEKIPADFLDLLQKPALAHLATVMPDGTPQVTPVWIDYDNEHILINTAKGRRKDLNVRERPQVGLDIVDPENPYRYLSIQGSVSAIIEEGAAEHIDKLAQRYLGVEKYPWHTPNETRVIWKIELRKVLVARP